MKVMLPRIQPINPLRIQTPVDDPDFICELTGQFVLSFVLF
jgi:hypothetical protein